MAIQFNGGEVAPSENPEFQGSVPSKSIIDKKRLIGRKEAPFYYKFHPFRWSVMDGEWLPVLGKLKVNPGENAVDKDGNISHARFEAENKGWKLLDWDIIEGSYIREYEHAAGKTYHERWITPRVVANKRMDKIDEEGYRLFLKALVTSGVVPLPDPQFIESELDRQRQLVDSALGRASTPHGQEAYAKQKRRLDEMESATNKLFPPEEPPKKAKVGTKK